MNQRILSSCVYLILTVSLQAFWDHQAAHWNLMTAIHRFQRSQMSEHLTTPASPSTQTHHSSNGPAAWEVSPFLKQASTARKSTSDSVNLKHDCFWTHETIMVHPHECNGQYLICNLGSTTANIIFIQFYIVIKITHTFYWKFWSFSIVLHESQVHSHGNTAI